MLANEKKVATNADEALPRQDGSSKLKRTTRYESQEVQLSYRYYMFFNVRHALSKRINP